MVELAGQKKSSATTSKNAFSGLQRVRAEILVLVPEPSPGLLALTRPAVMDALAAVTSALSMDVDSYAVEILQGDGVCGSAAGAAASAAEVVVDAVNKENINNDDALCGHEDATPKVRNALKLPCIAPCM